MSKSWAWLLLCLSSIACAQSIVIPASQCVVHAGDDPAWAAPDLDQSGWKPYAQYDFSFNQPRLWMRCKANVAAIRTAAAFTSTPERILSLLNDRLQGRGLVTCLALRIAPDGVASLANAGHLPPYINGQNLPVEGSMPLGAVSGISFPSMRFQLAPGDSLTLIFDGIVEARSPTGELFGFDRTVAISTQSAEAIAAAAQAFGQEDDITVLTLQYAPGEVLHA